MPSIKLKKKTQEYLAEKERSKQNVIKDPEPEPETEKFKKDVKEPKPKKTDKPPEDKELKQKPSEDKEPKQTPPEDIPDIPLVSEKRKRSVPPGEQKLTDWLADHVESREGACVSSQTLFEYFTDFCAQQNSPVTIESVHFNRVIKEKFGKEVGIKDTSPYKGLIRETKPKPKQMKVKAESLNKKMKDIIEEILKETGNPTCGIRFPTLKMAVASKYPALQVDLQPQKLVSALERGVYYGSIELVRGTGKCGFYRLFGVEPREDIKEKEEKEREKEKQKREEKLQKKKEKKEGEIENSEENKTQAEDTNQTETEKPKSKGTKRKVEKEGEEVTEAVDGEPKKKKKKRKIGRKPKWEKGDPHSNPEKIDDTFPLAFTYSSEPKEASYRKILKYLSDYYPSVNVETRLKPALEKGVEKGLWEQCSGTSTATGSFRLLVDDFDPESSKTTDDMICQAIVASHEPKQSTAIRIKQYLMDYHPDFNVESRPHNFKKAIERAMKKGVIRQITGIGLSGTFQLSNSFIPSPRILAGNEDTEGHWVVGDDVISDEKYVVRKTKSGRFAGRQA